ncbi:MAG TPA: allantoicase [Thermoanaerobaculia bacterium]|nr:allantoicase [Thermoanaerobaculia bacterium]
MEGLRFLETFGYPRALPHFTDLVDLAAERLGGRVLSANDDFFAEKENLLKAEPAVFVPDRYTDRGKWMDGWESRRRRTPGHDYCVIALGFNGVIRGLDVDTRHFKGNYPEACSVDAAFAPKGAPLEKLGTPEAPWREILPRTALKGDSSNLFPVFDRSPASHVRLHIYPDGGVARLRVHGDVAADWRALGGDGALVDLAALENGGLVLSFSDAFFGSYQNLLMPGRPSGMHDGWETKRSRREGSDWAIVRLGTRGAVERVEVDTGHFKGNFPDSFSIELCDAPGASASALADRGWRLLLPETKLAADTRHIFAAELLSGGPATHARLRITPDGGVARLRLQGRAVLPEALKRLNGAGHEEAVSELSRCCGSTRWAARVAEKRPFASHVDLFREADEAFADLHADDWLEAFRAHPRIGDRQALAARFASTRSWAEGEQAGALAADGTILDELAEKNAAYESRFGHIFIICATGQPAFRMLASVNDRLTNPPDIELAVAAEEQRKITHLRLEKLLST